MNAASSLIALLALGILTACGGSSSGGDAPRATLTVSPTSLEVFAASDIPTTLTVTNTSNSISVTAVNALLPAGWTDVVQDSSDCATLPPQASCTLSFTAGSVNHAQAAVDIRGRGAKNAPATIVINPANGAGIQALTATRVSMETGQSLLMQFLNNSATITATNISARLAGTALAGNVTQDASGCAAVLPGAVCTLQFTAIDTTVSPTSFSIKGDNTSTIGGSISISTPTSAQLSIAGSPLVLRATAGTPATGTLTVANDSATVTASNIRAELAGTALDGNLSQDASDCVALAPGQSCTLVFTPGSNAVAQTAVAIGGDNTSQVGASIVIDAPQATLGVAGSPLTLVASGTTESLVVTNLSNDTAHDVAANFTGTALDGNVAQINPPCTLAPFQSCNLTFAPGNTPVAQTSFAIAGSDTNTVVASMTIRALAAGDLFGGGMVLVAPSGNAPGLIVSTAGATISAWSSSNALIGAADNENGAANTETIVMALGNIGPAANYCDTLVDGSYSDWFLPAKNQLNAIMAAAAGLVPDPGLFSGSYYWSSTESDLNATFDAWARSSTGLEVRLPKFAAIDVRCVREFTL